MASESNMYVGGIDLGGTKIAAIVSTEEGRVLAKDKVSTPSGNFSVIAKAMVQSLSKACSSISISTNDLSAVGVGVPGSVDEQGNVAVMPNLGLENIAATAELGMIIGKPVAVENDVNLATLAEYHLGSGRGLKSIYGIIPGTGVGGGYIIEGKIIKGKNNTAGEIGHMVVKIDGPRCGCGQRGCLEAFVSKLGLARELRAAASKGEKSILMEYSGDRFTTMNSVNLKNAWDANDDLTHRLLTEQARILGIAVANVVNITGVHGFVIGGGVYEILGDDLLPIVRDTAEMHAIGGGMQETRLSLSELKGDATAIGAALLAKGRL